MSADEIVVTLIALAAGPLWWTMTFLFWARLSPLRPGARGVQALTVAVSVCGVAILLVLETLASFDVVDAPEYQFMYGVLGLAWLRIGERFFAFAGLSVRDDLIERRNGAAIAAMAGAFAGLTLCYAGGNIGDGPGWWVVVFSSGLASACWFAAWLLLAQFSPAMDAVTIDRDPAAGLRAGGFLAAIGLLLGRGAAGDWYSAGDTLTDVAGVLPAVGIILAIAIAVERTARPTAQRPRGSLVLHGAVPAVLYLAMAAAAVWSMEWPP
ncbi:MAG TPA: hypothetical protein VFK57_02370 [Vicinamibacterales bacterium]|nr:hypothetical protein [Vicinamibacterales bacterium]